MRPVTNGEFDRMAQQAKARIVLEDEFAFVMRYYNDSPATDVTWEETGYFGLFTIENQQASLRKASGIGATFTMVQTYGKIVMPLDYISGDLVIRSKDAPAEAFGRTFRPSHQFPGFLIADEVTCTKIRMITDKGRTVEGNATFDLGIREGANFLPESLPDIQLDSVLFYVQKADAIPYYKGQLDPDRRQTPWNYI